MKNKTEKEEERKCLRKEKIKTNTSLKVRNKVVKIKSEDPNLNSRDKKKTNTENRVCGRRMQTDKEDSLIGRRHILLRSIISEKLRPPEYTI